MRNNNFRKGVVLGIIVSIIGSVILTIVPVMKADLNDGLIGYWSFDNGTADDESGNNHHGTVYGATVEDGKSEKAFSFDGDDDYIDFGDDSDFDITGDITIALWFKTDTSQLGALVSKLDPLNPDNGYNLVMGDIIYNYPPVPDGTIYFMLAKDSIGLAQYDVAQTSSTFTDDTWHFLTAIYTPDGASRPKIFIDTVEQSVNYYGNALSSIGEPLGYPLKIAEYSFGSGYYNFKGSLDEVRIYDRALTNDEIQYLYDSPGGVDIVFVDDDYDSSIPGWQIDHFVNIQDGIDAVDEGGTVYVYNGIYYENVEITKDNIKLVGEEKDTTIIDGENQLGNCITIHNSDYIDISGFSIRNAKTQSPHSSVLEGNGICIQGFCSGSCGVTSNHNRISNCDIFSNDYRGVCFGSHDAGVHMDYNTIIDCEIYDNGYCGIEISAGGESYGLCYTLNTCITDCSIYNNGLTKQGIYIVTAGEVSNTIITGCNFYGDSGYGVYIELIWSGAIADNNIVYHNNFLNPINNAYDECTNFWYDTIVQEGNYWSDYTGVDSNNDGIGDTPYDIPGGSNQDLYPLMYPWYPSHPDTVFIDDDYDKTTIGFGYDKFNRIQYGINEVPEGGTVYVYNGTYYEHVVVDKTINLIGEDRNGTIIDGEQTGKVVYIYADWVNITRFTIQYSGGKFQDAGIWINSKYNNIYSNKFFYNCLVGGAPGILLNSASYNTVYNNYFDDNHQAIVFWSSHYNTILNNFITKSYWAGIDLVSGTYNTISGNILDNQRYGIMCRGNHNYISNNTIRNHERDGIYLGIGSSNHIIMNVITNNKWNGISSYLCGINLISKNIISDNKEYGIKIAQSSNHQIYENSIANNSLGGIYLKGLIENCVIYHNNLKNNTLNAQDEGNNNWDDGYPSGGNYWDDYTGIDNDGDGIGDTPYPIPGGSNQDNYPFMEPWSKISESIRQIKKLINDVEEMGLHQGLEKSLTSKLKNAIKSLENSNIDDTINQLNAFINLVEAQRGKKLTEEQADYLVAEAQAIIDSL